MSSGFFNSSISLSSEHSLAESRGYGLLLSLGLGMDGLWALLEDSWSVMLKETVLLYFLAIVPASAEPLSAELVRPLMIMLDRFFICYKPSLFGLS